MDVLEGLMTTAREPIPAHPGGVSPQWLTIPLRSEGIIRVGSVASFNFEIIGSDRGFTGTVARLHLSYDQPEPGAPATLVAKFPLVRPQESGYRAAHTASTEQSRRYWERCAREIQLYRQFANGCAITPHVYGTWMDPATQRMLLLLEDLSDGEPGDALLGCSIEQARLVVDRLAPLHARWWQQTDQSSLEWLPRWGDDSQLLAVRFRQILEVVLDRYGTRIPASIARLAREVVDGYEPLLRTLASRPRTIVHGDLHLDNLFFIGESGVRLLDWQGVVAGPAVIDLGVFLVGSLSVADRRKAEMDLLAQYHRRLIANGVRDYRLDELIADYHRSLIWQLAGIVGWLARADLASLAGRERALVEAIFTPGQVLAACIDHVDRFSSRA